MTFLLVVHMLIAAGIVGLVLLQRSEGGALGIGGSSGGGMGGLMAGRSAASFLTRATGILAAMFFASSILLSIFSGGGGGGGSGSILDAVPASESGALPALATPEAEPGGEEPGVGEAGTPATVPDTPPAAGVPLDE